MIITFNLQCIKRMWNNSLVDNQMKVHMPGGIIEIDIKSDGHVHMTGSVSSIASGTFSDEFWSCLE